MMMAIPALLSPMKNIRQYKQLQYIYLIAIGVHTLTIEKLLFEELRIQKKLWKML